MKKYLLFDLDGTLTDPKVGITTCVQYALKSFGIEEPDLDKLEPFIGPPLTDSFMKYYHMSEEQAREAVEKYRERFQDIGIFENQVYEGIPEMLRALQSKGMYLAVASSKPTVFVERILEHFDLRKYFKVVVGSELDGTRVNKDEVVKEAVSQLFGMHPVKREYVIMVGDRSFDVEGAKKFRVESVGVTYGYGSEEELREAGADKIVHSVAELRQYLMQGMEANVPRAATGVPLAGQPEKPVDSGLNAKRIMALLYAFVLFVLIKNIAVSLLGSLVVMVEKNFPEALGAFWVIRSDAGAYLGISGNLSAIITAIGCMGGVIPNINLLKELLHKTAADRKPNHPRPESVMNHLLLLIATVASVIGLNLLFELGGFAGSSDSYQQVVAKQYSANFAVGILVYGLITPIAEELVFRGVIFNGLRRFMKYKTALVMGIILFGAYHMNMVQGVYGALMGAVILFSYEYFGSFLYPVLVHILANVIAYCLADIGAVLPWFAGWPVCITALVLAAGALWLLHKQKNILLLYGRMQ